MIKVENVSYKYKNNNIEVLKNLNFSVNDGEIIAIVGKNGSGKSTIGKLVAGITKMQQGNIRIDDIDISDKKNYNELQNKVGIVFQNPENQIIFSNIKDELSFALKGLKKEEVEQRIDHALEQVGMLDKKEQDLYLLSLGQKQRIMIAEILAKNSKYIILDEPTTMIDSQGKEKIYQIIKKLKDEGYTIICITNVADEVLLADRILILNEGQIVHEINKKELVEKSSILEEYGIKQPTLLKILTELKKSGIDLNIEEFSIEEFVKRLKGKIEWRT